MDPFSFAGSDDLIDIPLSVRILNLVGDQTHIPYSVLLKRPDLRHIGSVLSANSDLYVTVQLWADSKPLSIPIPTCYKAFKNERRWNETLTLPVAYASLPLSSQLAITVWELSPSNGTGVRNYEIPFGGTTLPLFDKDNTLHKGRQKCRLYRGRPADGLSATTTPAIPAIIKQKSKEHSSHVADGGNEEADRIEKLLKKHEMGEISRIDWLDQLVWRAAEKQRQQTLHFSDKADSERKLAAKAAIAKLSDRTTDQQDFQAVLDTEVFTLFVELPRFDFPVVFADHEYPPQPVSVYQNGSISQSGTLKPPPEIQLGPGILCEDDSGFGGRLIRIYDPEIGARDNPVESKHRRLVRGHRTGIHDRDLRPNPKVRDELNNIMSYSPTHVLSGEEKDLVWRFRHHLSRDKRALTKFVKSVAWQDPNESKQAVLMLAKWTDIDVDDAIELLGPAFDNPAVRAFAVKRLRKSDDDELMLYLLQLVQALKYEQSAIGIDNEVHEDPSLATFLISRATQNFILGNFLHWYLIVELDDPTDMAVDMWQQLYMKTEYDFMAQLVKLSDGTEKRDTLRRQGELVAVLSRLAHEVKSCRGEIRHKVDVMKRFIAEPKNELNTINPPLPLPLDPTIMITGVHADESAVFKSSLLPMKLTFKTSSTKSGKYEIIFKVGDDLRQDQLIIQTITLMDQLLRKENLDLKLMPYKILATGRAAGAVQFVKSTTLHDLQKKYSNEPVLSFLRANNPDANGPLGMRRETLDTYVRSCAGYCVMTYILGVGDRHLENLLLSPNGHFFHADFGFILGRDPKPFAPQMRVASQMIDGMGGRASPQYKEFKNYCFTAFSTLRKSSNLILNLFGLMLDASIHDIDLEKETAVMKIKERFHLQLNEDGAMRFLDRLIEDEGAAWAPVVMDKLHGLTQGLRH